MMAPLLLRISLKWEKRRKKKMKRERKKKNAKAKKNLLFCQK